MKDIRGFYTKFSIVSLFVFLVALTGCTIATTPGAMMTGAVWKNAPSSAEKVTFPNDKYELYMADVSGTAYGWKFACFIPVSTPDLGNAIDEIWKKSKVSPEERKDMVIVNVTERWGTYWSCFVLGQNYLTATGDIVKLKK